MPPDPEFSFRVARDGSVFITWQGRVVKTLRGVAAAKFAERAAGLDPETAQLLMAKATGNFKRGNERR